MIQRETGLAEERLKLIRTYLREKEVVSVDELVAELNVSAATVRRDLAELDERGKLRRVHGGAVSVESRLNEPGFDDKTGIAAKEKSRIAQEALKLVNPRDSIFLDGGSAVFSLAGKLIEMNQLTAVTNSLRVANVFSASGPRTLLVGGEFRRLSQTFVGAMTRPMIKHLHVDTAFMGTNGLLEGGELMATDSAEALTKELVMSKAGRIVVLAESSKIGQASFVRFGCLGKGDTLITDSGADSKIVGKFERMGINVITTK